MRCESFLYLSALAQIYGSWLSPQGSMVVVILVVSLGLQEVVRLHDPRWSVGGVIVIVLH